MAEAKTPSYDPIGDFKLLILFLTFAWLFWLVTGGPAKYEESQKPFIRPPAVGVDDQNIWKDPSIGEQYGSISNPGVSGNIGDLGSVEGKISGNIKSDGSAVIGQDQTGNSDGQADDSLKIDISGRVESYGYLDKPVLYLSKGQADSSGKSYLKIDFPSFNQSNLRVTGLSVRNIFGRTASVGSASNLPYQGLINEERDVVARPGSTVYIIDGQSPIGVSFRINKCIGYLAKFQSFHPSLPELDASLGGSTYNRCVEAHKNDTDFYKDDWRIYLGNSDKVWIETGDLIRVRDGAGQTLVSTFY